MFNGKDADLKLGERLSKLKSGLLLHACCGPCATAVTERIIEFIKPTLYYYNPNIYPKAEYELRLRQLEKVAKHFGVKLICEPYDEVEFFSRVVGLEKEKEGGKRCPSCFSLRLEKTAKRAVEYGYGAICTTLTVSPHKNATLINGIGETIAGENSLTWILSDFKKRNGYLRSVELSEEIGLYRQSYCGCRFALGSENDNA